MNENITKCAACGRFVSYQEMEDHTARFEFTPDSDRSTESSEWICARCVRVEQEQVSA